MIFTNTDAPLTAFTNWQLAMLLWPFVVLTLLLMAVMVFWPQVTERAGRLRRAIGGLLRGRSADDGTSNDC